VGSKPSDGKRELSHSISMRRPSWDKMTLMDTPRNTLRERRPSKKFQNFVALICSIINSMNSSILGEDD